MSRTLFISLCIVSLVISVLLPSCQPVVKRPGLRGHLHAESREYAVYRPGTGEDLADIAKAFYGRPENVWRIEDAAEEIGGPEDTVIVPLRDRHRGGLYDGGYQGVPILCYHQFGTGSPSSMNMPEEVFEKQMRYLKKEGYRVISPKELLGFLEYRRQIPKKAVIITVDDGYHSFLDVAYPILKKYGFTATLFIYTDYIGLSRKALSWEDLRLLKKEGFTIGSHSVSHSDLSRAKEGESEESSARRIRDEVWRSKEILDRELGQDTFCFSFPFGRSSRQVVDLVKQAGYTLSFSVQRGTNPFFTDPYELKRDMILKRDMKAFVSRLKTFNSVSLR